jgi:hypothetical protein
MVLQEVQEHILKLPLQVEQRLYIIIAQPIVEWEVLLILLILLARMGFKLKFQLSNALGDDTSGKGNDFTSSGLTTTDQTTDSPTQNSNTFGSTSSGVTLSEGNLTVNTGTSGSYIQAVGQPAFGVRSGKWYWEVKNNNSWSSSLWLER